MDSKIILYSIESESISVDVTFLNDTFWLPQKAIAHLFNVEIPAISKHLSNIYEFRELVREATISILETVQVEGGRKL